MFKQALQLTLAIAPFAALSAVLSFALPSRASEAPKVSGPHTHANLSIYFIHGKSAGGPVPLTLEEALAKGFAEVRETDTVSQLVIENKGKEAVFIQAGDIVKGGKQDRVVTASFTLPPNSKPVDIPVYCVEAGRWAPRGQEDSRKFSASAQMLPTREAKLAMMAASAPPARNAGAETLDIQQRAEPSRSVETAGIQQRQSANGGSRQPSAQSEVWRNVSEIQQKLAGKLKSKVAATESESSLQLALENKELAAEQDKYISALQASGENADDIVGFAIAVDGKIASADVYASNALFRKLWPKLLKAAATEAIGATVSADAKAPGNDEVVMFLMEAPSDSKDVSTPVAGVTRAVRDTPEAHDAITRTADGAFLHRAKVKR